MAGTPEQWTIEDLHTHLQAALELELLVIPPYLTALYSLQPGTNEQAELIIRSVVVEEMLHMTLVANVYNAVGGKPRVNNPEWTPKYPAKLPLISKNLPVSLRPFSPDALKTFLGIENPSYPIPKGPSLPPGVELAEPRLLTLDAGGEEYKSVGAFYEAIKTGLKSLVEQEKKSNGPKVFTGDPSLQIGSQYYYASGGEVVTVTGLPSALAAITEIVEQGEGEVTEPPSGDKFDPSQDLAHFYRFMELKEARRYKVEDMPDKPTGEPIDIDFKAVYPVKRDLRLEEITAGELHDAVESNCHIWSRLLDQIQAGISGNPSALSDAVATMFELKYSSQQLLRNPLPGGNENAGPTFQYLPTPS